MCSCALCEEKKPVRALRVPSRKRVRNVREDVSRFLQYGLPSAHRNQSLEIHVSGAQNCTPA